MVSAFLKKATSTIFCGLIWFFTSAITDWFFPHAGLAGTVFLGLFTLLTVVFALSMLIQRGDKFLPVVASPFVAALLAAFFLALFYFWPLILLLALLTLLSVVIAAYWKGWRAS